MSIVAEIVPKPLTATLHYLKRGAEKPTRYVFDPPPGVPQWNGTDDPRQVAIEDARGREDDFTLDRNGFQLVRAASTVGDFYSSEEVERIRNEWVLRPMPIPLDIEEAGFRDLGDPLLRYLRGITADPDTVAVVVMPELVFSGPQRLLHNQRALYIKRLLLFEPRVILTSVPYRLS